MTSDIISINIMSKVYEPYESIGLENCGNSCYMNSAIQMLLSINEYREYIINSNSRNEKNNITSTFTIAVVIYTFTLVSILFILGIYLYLLHRFTNLIIDWKTIFIVLLIVNIFIILYELLYLFFILIKKQFNSNEITYELINMFL